jgi:predicted ribosome quality control (RQC) complex YloA/Tae2 family protein
VYVSNGIRFDALLVRDLAAELNSLLAGRPLRALLFDRVTRRVELRLDEFDLHWLLHLEQGAVVRTAPARWKGNVALARGSRIARVQTPPDERVLEIDIGAMEDATRGHARSLIIELLPQRWNAFALGEGRRITALLRPAETPARQFALGDEYQAPRPSLRLGNREALELDDWLRLLLPTPPVDRRRRLLDTVAYTSPLNSRYILGSAAHDAEAPALRAAFFRYRGLVWTDDRRPCVLGDTQAPQPYSHPLGDSDAFGTADLLRAFDEALHRLGAASVIAASLEALTRDATAALHARLVRIDARVARLRQELDGAPAEAAAKRRLADLLLSQMHAVPRGAEYFDLDDFAGGFVRVPLDPSLGVAENAQLLYDLARKRDRAVRQLPRLLEEAEQERARLLELMARIAQGVATEPEIRSAAGLEVTAQRRRRRPAARLPYRRYRTSSGREVRVGKSAAANDELTLRHTSPSDIWLHARDVGGAHVVLRWSDREANPPARDLAEAAMLAALHSRARTSATVPVDWTRRKYVRKPRGARPGSVVLERARTLFVEPDPELEEKLRWDQDTVR